MPGTSARAKNVRMRTFLTFVVQVPESQIQPMQAPGRQVIRTTGGRKLSACGQFVAGGLGFGGPQHRVGNTHLYR